MPSGGYQMNKMKGYVEDPELHDEDDPAYQEEMFELFRTLDWKPEDLADQKYAAKYAEWLKTASRQEK